MTILQKLINAMLQRIEAVPVPQQELDDFLAQNQIQLSPEHYRFLLDYGNSPFLTNEMACLNFDYFKGYYYELEHEFLEGLILPPNSGYLGTDFLSEADASRKKSYPICRINPLQICCTMCNSVSKHQTRLSGGFNLWWPSESTEEPPNGNQFGDYCKRPACAVGKPSGLGSAVDLGAYG